MSERSGRRPPFTFCRKAASALLLVILADWLFLFHEVGLTVGVFALAWALLTVATQRAIWRDSRARLAVLAALFFALVQVDHLHLIAWCLFWVSLTVAVLLPATGRFDDAFRWGQRAFLSGFISLVGPILDLRTLRRTGRLKGLKHVPALLPMLALPLAGGAVFLLLFASANPLISDAFARLHLPRLDVTVFVRLVILGIVLVMVWGALRPRRRRTLLSLPESRDRVLPGVTTASVTLSLVVFNALFLLQNGLDAAFLWSGAALPEGVTLAEYAHRGAYPLIATALLAGLFVLVALSPGSPTARLPWVRRLVVVWVLQNLFLVASTALRTIDYIEVYSLTRMRIAALAWMALVAAGLVLICWRMLRRKSAGWLVNANTAAAGLVLTAACVADLGGVAANWNVVHAREAGGRGAAVDLCYLASLHGSAVAPLARMEARTPEGAFRDRLTFVRSRLQAQLAHEQSDWRAWTWRGSRQLEAARAVGRQAGLRVALSNAGERRCDGTPYPPPVVPAVAPPASIPGQVVAPSLDAAPSPSPDASAQAAPGAAGALTRPAQP